jgi:hypothetical protein
VTQQNDELETYFSELVAHRDENNKPMTQQAMADQLNAKGVPSLSGKPWSKYSVRRMLNKLSLGASPAPAKAVRAGAKTVRSGVNALSDDEIRNRIRKGLYDTEEERFVAVSTKEQGKKKKKKSKQDKKKKK